MLGQISCYMQLARRLTAEIRAASGKANVRDVSTICQAMGKSIQGVRKSFPGSKEGLPGQAWTEPKLPEEARQKLESWNRRLKLCDAKWALCADLVFHLTFDDGQQRPYST